MTVCFLSYMYVFTTKIIFSVTDNSTKQKCYNISRLISVISSITITLEFLLWYTVLSTFTSLHFQARDH